MRSNLAGRYDFAQLSTYITLPMSRSHLLGAIGVRNQIFVGFFPKIWLNMAIFDPQRFRKRVKMREWGAEKGPNQLFS